MAEETQQPKATLESLLPLITQKVGELLPEAQAESLREHLNKIPTLERRIAVLESDLKEAGKAKEKLDERIAEQGQQLKAANEAVAKARDILEREGVLEREELAFSTKVAVMAEREKHQDKYLSLVETIFKNPRLVHSYDSKYSRNENTPYEGSRDRYVSSHSSGSTTTEETK